MINPINCVIGVNTKKYRFDWKINEKTASFAGRRIPTLGSWGKLEKGGVVGFGANNKSGFGLTPQAPRYITKSWKCGQKMQSHTKSRMCAQMIHAYLTNDLTLQQTRLAACQERDVVINGIASPPSSALRGNARSTRLGEVRWNRFGPLLARSKHYGRRQVASQEICTHRKSIRDKSN